MTQEIGIIGLGKMGKGLALQLLEKDWRVVGYNRTKAVSEELAKDGLIASDSLKDLISKLSTPRIVWLMLPAGDIIDEHIFGTTGLINYLEPGDIVVEGGNSFYKDDAPRAEKLKAKGINYIDVGVSGGPGGARNGACLMIGGDEIIYKQLEPLFIAISKPDAYQHFPGIGAGHFVKMVHNGIEYGMMQAIAEGYAVLKAAPFNLSLTDVTKIYNNGSVIESRLTNWLAGGFKDHGENLDDVSGTVAHTGEGAWTVETAKELNIPTPIISGSLEFRKESTENPSYTGQVLSALREQFGGHAIK